VLNPVVAVAGAVVEIEPEAVTINGRRPPSSSTEAGDEALRELPEQCGSRVVGAQQHCVVSAWIPNRRDSRTSGRPRQRVVFKRWGQRAGLALRWSIQLEGAHEVPRRLDLQTSLALQKPIVPPAVASSPGLAR
jgi:hypothetical protein